jgi:hypothetical protein
MGIFPSRGTASKIFGRAADAYGPIIDEIETGLLSEEYAFEDLDVFEARSLERDGRGYSGRVYWTEMLYRARMASVASILRTTRWAGVATREYEAGSLFGWAAACRGLIECAGDTGQSLGIVPLTLAQAHRVINKEISGNGSGPIVTSPSLEDSLIHFTHARNARGDHI